MSTNCDAWTKLLLLSLLLVLLPRVSKLPLLVFMLPGPCMLLLLPEVPKLLLELLILLVLSCTMKLVLLFLVLMPPCVKLLLLGTLCFTSSILAEHDAIVVLLASTSLGNRS
jgi:hypothetical protein